MRRLNPPPPPNKQKHKFDSAILTIIHAIFPCKVIYADVFIIDRQNEIKIELNLANESEFGARQNAKLD